MLFEQWCVKINRTKQITTKKHTKKQFWFTDVSAAFDMINPLAAAWQTFMHRLSCAELFLIIFTWKQLIFQLVIMDMSKLKSHVVFLWCSDYETILCHHMITVPYIFWLSLLSKAVSGCVSLQLNIDEHYYFWCKIRNIKSERSPWHHAYKI